jgi:hypothetical protein
MLRAKNRLVRGCLMLVLASCILLGAGALFAIEHIRLARAANPRQNVLFNVGPLYVGSPCAQLQATYPTIRCKVAYYVVVKVNESQLWSMQLP